ncbi:hypothetical protein MUN46_005395 [Mesosutterella sp. AGMB02718]|uniref:Uncharacterized protein n=1 Tax=Mesosutterella faecium TaxID=2925194 RepID=A0ABT7ILX5_9BURK|nr:hypothetical protein [Mesosutterella sp. AGMB02718]MDL2059365.1 hypothetical protein [Mesosutterella sp. AGMB02718]
MENGGPELEKLSLDDLGSLLATASGDPTLLNPTETDLEMLEWWES